MHCYRDGSCFYYCESSFNIVIFYFLLNRCKLTLNCYFCFLAFLFRFLILSCAFEHFMEFAHYKCFIIIIIIIINRPFYRYGDHIELIRLKEYYRMPRGHEHISFLFSSAFRDIFLKVFLE